MRRLDVQTEKEESLYLYSIQKSNFLNGSAKRSFFWQLLTKKNPPNTQKKGGIVGCRGVNRAALSQFMGQNKTAKKKKKNHR